jgi:hypothetical protein
MSSQYLMLIADYVRNLTSSKITSAILLMQLGNTMNFTIFGKQKRNAENQYIWQGFFSAVLFFHEITQHAQSPTLYTITQPYLPVTTKLRDGVEQ